MNPADLDLELLVALHSCRRRSLLGRVVGVRGDLGAVLGEHPADRLDPEAVLVLIDEPHDRCCRRSSSAPKKVAAAF